MTLVFQPGCPRGFFRQPDLACLPQGSAQPAASFSDFRGYEKRKGDEEQRRQPKGHRHQGATLRGNEPLEQANDLPPMEDNMKLLQNGS